MRFQSASFKKQLTEARNYKRAVKTRKPSDPHYFGVLEFVGLTSLWQQLVVLGVLAVLLYFLFIPNFLFIRHVSVTGVDEPAQAALATSAKMYMAQRHIPSGKHYIFLNADGLKAYIANENPTLRVEAVKKIWPNKLAIQAQARTAAFYARWDQDTGIISTDGLVLKFLPSLPAASTTPELQALIPVKGLPRPEASGLYAWAEPFRQHLERVREYVPRLANSPIREISFHEKDMYMDILLEQGYHVLIAPKVQSEEIEQKLKAILNDYTPGQKQGLSYIDLRFKERGFACFKDQLCSQPAQPANDKNATSSESSL